MPKFTKVLSVVALTGAVVLIATGIADAQPRRGGYRGPRGGGGRVIVARPYYNPWFYNGWYGSPYGGWYGFGYPIGYPYGGFGYGGFYRSADLRLQVEPRQAEVFVDGYYAGVVDDFDGTFQRLRVEPGEHEIQVYLDGYRGIHQKVYVQANKTFNIKDTLEPLGPGDAPEPRPTAPAPPPAADSGSAGTGSNRGPDSRPMPGSPFPGSGRAAIQGERGNAGSVALRVQPYDAEIFIDGEPWQGSAGGDRLVIQLSEGEHRIEVRKQGYVSFESTIRVRTGDTTPFNVSLSRQ